MRAVPGFWFTTSLLGNIPIATLKTLPTSPRTKVFRAVVALLQQNPVILSCIKPDSFRSWSGRSHDAIEFSSSMYPAIRITPTNGPEGWIFPTAMRGWLYLNVDMLIFGTDADDQLNLWWAVEKAIYPDVYSQQQANVAALQAAGAYTGLCEFSQPAFDPLPIDKIWAATGQIKIEILLQLTG